jgi:putative hemolysin
MPVDEMADRIGVVLPAQRSYETVAGFVLAQLQHLPQTGEHIDAGGWRFEVIDIDGRAARSRTPHRLAVASTAG